MVLARLGTSVVVVGTTCIAAIELVDHERLVGLLLRFVSLLSTIVQTLISWCLLLMLMSIVVGDK